MYLPVHIARVLGGAIVCIGVFLAAHSGPALGQSHSGRFSFPVGIVLDRQGNVYVADADLDHIQKLSVSGKTLATWGSTGSALGQFDYPDSITLDNKGNIYVADANNNRIQKLSPTGRPLGQWQVPFLPKHKYVGLESVALDTHGHLYVTEFETRQVVELAPNGPVVRTWLTRGEPYGLAIDATGHLYVAADAIQEFSLSGRLLRTVGDAALHPGSIALDRQGDLYVTDVVHMKVLKLSPSGKLLAAWGSKGSKPGQFNYPQAITLDAAGDIYIADGYNHRIQKLSPSGQVLAIWQ